MDILGKVGTFLAEFAAAMNAPSNCDGFRSSQTVINPSTGLPTVGGVGTPDLAGTTWGTYDGTSSSICDDNTFPETAINPGTGLPTIAGIGSPDVAGNAWGSGFPTYDDTFGSGSFMDDNFSSSCGSSMFDS
ncbi:hypothetical protein [Noviherbaspirillum pedocola]|uniref:Uncharacterized protein n=1 Tax=Noviherbaspirillum pedocola TaxID=2801341 RepID=A0A934W5B6_9BURK|nr:hypothetical protein [Noviherbaspirillum pedocola]MBK4733033.1 hypothetical protein [Noviherbaspirillum pedocola]